MLPKAIRLDLRHRPEFFNKPDSVRTEHLLVLFKKDVSLSGTRLAVVIKKGVGSAVKRGKIRRMLRSAITALWKQDSSIFSAPSAVVVIPRGRLVDYQKYKSELLEALRKISSS